MLTFFDSVLFFLQRFDDFARLFDMCVLYFKSFRLCQLRRMDQYHLHYLCNAIFITIGFASIIIANAVIVFNFEEKPILIGPPENDIKPFSSFVCLFYF